MDELATAAARRPPKRIRCRHRWPDGADAVALAGFARTAPRFFYWERERRQGVEPPEAVGHAAREHDFAACSVPLRCILGEGAGVSTPTRSLAGAGACRALPDGPGSGALFLPAARELLASSPRQGPGGIDPEAIRTIARGTVPDRHPSRGNELNNWSRSASVTWAI
ncbi:MAG: hypothetical protein R3E68_21775 [Burkholderiaceae bacterium]